MAQPTQYTVATDFSTDEDDAVGGRSTVRTAALDAELAAIETTLDGVLDNLALNQRDDGEIRDGRVKLFTLASDVLALMETNNATPRGAWASGTSYALKDLAVSSGNTYLAVIAHTASGSFATDLAAGKWILFAVGTAPGASSVTFAPTATLAATNVQAAIEEADTENRALSAAASTSVTSLIASLLSSAGAAAVGFLQAGTGAVLRTVQAKLRERVSIPDFSTIANAITTGGTLVVPPGTYAITTNTDFGTCSLEFAEGALFNVTAGVKVTIRKQIKAGDYQIFSLTGNIICTGQVNPMWWGAVTSTSSPGATVAKANTDAFRRAAKSFYADYTQVNGTVASPSGPQLAWELVIPPGIFYLSNGFCAPVGVPVRGAGVASLLCRLTANADGDTAIPLLTIGQTLAAAPGLAYQVDPGGQSSSAFTSAGFPNTAAQCHHLYFVDQNPTVAAFMPNYPGAQFHDLFFTSCGIAIDFTGCGDVTGSNFVIDMGLTALNLRNCQNINLSDFVLYNQAAQAIGIGSNVLDTGFDNFTIEYPQVLGVYFSEGSSNVTDVNFSNGRFLMNGQYPAFAGMVRNRADDVHAAFSDCQFRNIYGPTILNDLVTTGCEITFADCLFDGLKTNSAYSQSSTMTMGSVYSGDWTFNNCEVKNLFGPFQTAFGDSNLTVNGFKYSAMDSYTGAIFAFDGTGTANFLGVLGDNVKTLFSLAVGTYSVRVRGSLDWLGAPFTDGSYLSWKIPAGLGEQYIATITARASSGSAVELRKSKSYIVEKSCDSNTGMFDILSSATLWGSPTLGGVAEIAATFVFSNDTTSQAAAYPGSTYWKLRVSNAYVNIRVNLDMLN